MAISIVLYIKTKIEVRYRSWMGFPEVQFRKSDNLKSPYSQQSTTLTLRNRVEVSIQDEATTAGERNLPCNLIQPNQLS